MPYQYMKQFNHWNFWRVGEEIVIREPVLLFADESGTPLPPTEDDTMRTIDTEHNEFWQQGFSDGREGLRAIVPDEARYSFERSDYYAGHAAGRYDRYARHIEPDEVAGRGEEYAVCSACKSSYPADTLRRGEDDERYCGLCYDSTGQDPGALQGIDPEN